MTNTNNEETLYNALKEIDVLKKKIEQQARQIKRQAKTIEDFRKHLKVMVDCYMMPSYKLNSKTKRKVESLIRKPKEK